jgi:hypothetical protein
MNKKFIAIGVIAIIAIVALVIAKKTGYIGNDNLTKVGC